MTRSMCTVCHGLVSLCGSTFLVYLFIHPFTIAHIEHLSAFPQCPCPLWNFSKGHLDLPLPSCSLVPLTSFSSGILASMTSDVSSSSSRSSRSTGLQHRLHIVSSHSHDRAIMIRLRPGLLTVRCTTNSALLVS